MNDFLMKIYPFWIAPSSLLCDVEMGELFRDSRDIYRLIYRDPWKARIVRWNWWTQMWWGGRIERG